MFDRVRHFTAAFCIALIFIGTICGFAVVDLSSDIYMPGQFNSMLQVNEINSDGVSFTFMGSDYIIGGVYTEPAEKIICRYRGLLPAPPRLVREVVLLIAGNRE